MAVGRSTLSKWARLYRGSGDAGLQSKSANPSPKRPKVAAAVKTLPKYHDEESKAGI
jgi:transposase-like protein